MLRDFINNHSHTDQIFRHFAPFIAKDLGVPLHSEEDYSSLFDWLPDAPGFNEKLEPIKLMRWFSANGRHHSECVSFWVVKMLLVEQLKGEDIDWNEVG